jgi:hypothetical protein
MRTVELFGDRAENMAALDLQAEYKALQEAGRRPEVYRVRVCDVGIMLPEAGWLLWLPDDQRGGVAWGADAIWTDADSPDDCAVRVIVTGEVIN